MNHLEFTGALLRMYRLDRNWSQETLCSGICTVSYLSKIEQGKAQPNDALLQDLFGRMDIPWQTVSEEEGAIICEQIFEAVFADDRNGIERCKEEGLLRQEGLAMGVKYLDYLVLRAYCFKEVALIPEQMYPLLDNRQKCLLLLLQEQAEEAMKQYPCALTIQAAGMKAYANGAYAQALELLQRAYDLACQEGYAEIMMYCQVYMANCYSDLRNIPNMLSHCKIAKRLANLLGDEELLQTIEYNIASTRIECGDYQAGYSYFSNLIKPSVLDLHKLAICCEMLNKQQEAIRALDIADKSAQGLEKQMCKLVRYRLENPSYLKESAYEELLLTTFRSLQKEKSAGYARFHLSRVEEWCTANRQYRMAYEIIRDFL